MGSSRARVGAALLVLFALTLGLKLWGLRFSLPHAIEPDSHLALAVGVLRGEAEKPNRHKNDAQYPLLVARIGQIAPREHAPPKSERTLQQHLDAASSLYVLTRTVVAILSALIIPFAFLFARYFVPTRWALLAAALCGASLLHQFFAQQARPHAPGATMFLASVVASMRMRRTPTVRWYCIAGVAAALALGTLQSGLAVLIPGLAAHFLRDGPRRARDHWKLLIPIGLIAVSLPLFQPFLFASGTDADFARPHIDAEGFRFSKHVLAWSDFNGGGAVVVLRALTYFEPMLVPLLAIALFALLAKRWSGVPIEVRAERGDRVVALAFALPYLGAIALFGSTFERFALPLVPYWVTFGVWGAWQLSRPLHETPVRIGAVSLALAALVVHAATSARLAWLRSLPDTLQITAAWISEHGTPQSDALMISPTIDLPLARTAASLSGDERYQPQFSRWASYQTRMPAGTLPPPLWNVEYLTVRKDLGYPTANQIAADASGYVRALGPGWYVIDATTAWRHESYWRIRDSLHQLGKLAFRSAPIDHGIAPDFSLHCADEIDDTDPPPPWIFPRVWQAHAVGPVVEVYRVAAR